MAHAKHVIVLECAERLEGVQHLDGARALAYARVRKNELDKTDSDVSRGQRGQQVIAAIRGKLASPGSIFRLRKVGETVADPLATDVIGPLLDHLDGTARAKAA